MHNCIELFAGVGGFRLGLENAGWYTAWSNQWEPSTKKQDASDVYCARFGVGGHSNCDISKVDAKGIPDHELLVGGFPCQDYSVAKPLHHSNGIEGKKGVLWWEIYRILKEKRPKYVLLENVNRLLKSPSKTPGKDFAMILTCFNWVGFSVEWRVINAADYGFPQRRKRVFIVATHHQRLDFYLDSDTAASNLRQNLVDGVLGQAFPFTFEQNLSCTYWKHSEFYDQGALNPLDADAFYNSSESYDKKVSPFMDAGIMHHGTIYSTSSIKPHHTGVQQVLGHVLSDDVPEEFFIKENTLDKWKYLKGAKNEPRTNKTTGFEYTYNEGAVEFPDSVIKPSRTIITSEGGTGPSRTKHVIPDNGRYRRLTPVELERLNGFPDGWTSIPGISDTKRAFLMGNALVVGIVQRIGHGLLKEAMWNTQNQQPQDLNCESPDTCIDEECIDHGSVCGAC